MSLARELISLFVIAATGVACSVDGDPRGTGKACSADDRCLAGFVCSANHRCVPVDGKEDAAPDAADDVPQPERDASHGTPDGTTEAASTASNDEARAPEAGPATASDAGAGDASQDATAAGDTDSAVRPDAHCPAPSVYFRDSDGDGFGSDRETVQACSPPTEEWIDRADDCDDENADVFPGQTRYFTAPYETADGDSFDYDCSGSEDPDPSSPGAAPECASLLLGLACTGSGFAPTERTAPEENPICGSTEVVTCVSALLSCMPAVSEAAEKPCR